MNIQKYQNYLSFFLGILFFLIIITYSFMLYLRWNKDLENGDYVVEVSLPVMDWGSYSSLSKQYHTDKIN